MIASTGSLRWSELFEQAAKSIGNVGDSLEGHVRTEEQLNHGSVLLSPIRLSTTSVGIENQYQAAKKKAADCSRRLIALSRMINVAKRSEKRNLQKLWDQLDIELLAAQREVEFYRPLVGDELHTELGEMVA